MEQKSIMNSKFRWRMINFHFNTNFTYPMKSGKTTINGDFNDDFDCIMRLFFGSDPVRSAPRMPQIIQISLLWTVLGVFPPL